MCQRPRRTIHWKQNQLLVIKWTISQLKFPKWKKKQKDWNIKKTKERKEDEILKKWEKKERRKKKAATSGPLSCLLNKLINYKTKMVAF